MPLTKRRGVGKTCCLHPGAPHKAEGCRQNFLPTPRCPSQSGGVYAKRFAYTPVPLTKQAKASNSKQQQATASKSKQKQAKASKSKQKQPKASKSKQKQAKASKSKQKQTKASKSKQKQAKASKSKQEQARASKSKPLTKRTGVGKTCCLHPGAPQTAEGCRQNFLPTPRCPSQSGGV